MQTAPAENLPLISVADILPGKLLESGHKKQVLSKLTSSEEMHNQGADT